MDRNPYLHPIVHQIDALESPQKERVRKIAFWTLFAYWELWVLSGAAAALLMTVVLVGAVITVVSRRRDVPHAHAAVLHAGVVGGLIAPLASQWSWVAALDATLLIVFSAWFVRSERVAALLAVVLTHIASLLWSPATAMSQAKFSGSVSGLVFARILAVALLLIVAARMVRARRLPEPVAEPVLERPRRPLTAAEWDAEKREKSVV